MPGRIQISVSTRELIEPHFELEPRGPIEVSGTGKVETWFLLGRSGEEALPAYR